MERNELEFWVYYYLQFANTLMYIVKDRIVNIFENNVVMKEKLGDDDR